MMEPPVGPFEQGAGKQVVDGSRHEHLAGLGESLDSCRDVGGDAAHVIGATLDLTGVDADRESQGQLLPDHP